MWQFVNDNNMPKNMHFKVTIIPQCIDNDVIMPNVGHVFIVTHTL